MDLANSGPSGLDGATKIFRTRTRLEKNNLKLSSTLYFFSNCCQVDPATRPTAQEIVEELIPIHQLQLNLENKTAQSPHHRGTGTGSSLTWAATSLSPPCRTQCLGQNLSFITC